jgi:hypothetical protein
VTLRRAGVVLRGRGLKGDATLRRVVVERDVDLTLDLDRAELPWATVGEKEAAAPFPVLCGGPLVLEEIEPEPGESRRLRVVAEDRVRGSRARSPSHAGVSTSFSGWWRAERTAARRSR